MSNVNFFPRAPQGFRKEQKSTAGDLSGKLKKVVCLKNCCKYGKNVLCYR